MRKYVPPAGNTRRRFELVVPVISVSWSNNEIVLHSCIVSSHFSLLQRRQETCTLSIILGEESEKDPDALLLLEFISDDSGFMKKKLFVIYWIKRNIA